MRESGFQNLLNITFVIILSFVTWFNPFPRVISAVYNNKVCTYTLLASTCLIRTFVLLYTLENYSARNIFQTGKDLTWAKGQRLAPFFLTLSTYLFTCNVKRENILSPDRIEKQTDISILLFFLSRRYEKISKNSRTNKYHRFSFAIPPPSLCQNTQRVSPFFLSRSLPNRSDKLSSFSRRNIPHRAAQKGTKIGAEEYRGAER